MLHLALATLASLDHELALLQGAALSAEESARLTAASRPLRAAQFLAGRRLARQLLSQVLGGKPADWRISAQPGQAPRILNQTGLFLSLSHTGQQVACALSSEPLGLDIERLDATRDVLAMADMVASPAELAQLQALPRELQSAYFHGLWTRKEAGVKWHAGILGLHDILCELLPPGSALTAQMATWHCPSQALVLSLASPILKELQCDWPPGWQAHAEFYRFLPAQAGLNA